MPGSAAENAPSANGPIEAELKVGPRHTGARTGWGWLRWKT